MTKFSASDAAFEGFRLARERPMAIVYWTALWLVASLIIEFVSARLGGEAFAELVRLSQNPSAEPDTQAAIALYAQLVPMLAVVIPITLVFYAVTSAAAYRLVLFREQRPPALHLGMDEVRQVGLMIVIGAILFGVEIVALMAVFLVAGLAALIQPAVGAALGGLGAIAFVCLIIFIAVRFSLAGPMTLDRRRISPFGSWTLTRGLFWRLFGAYFLAFILALIVTLLGAAIVGGVAAVLGGGLTAATALVIPETTSFVEFFTPARIVLLLGNAALSALTFAIISATPTVIYRSLTAEGRAPGELGGDGGSHDRG